MERIDKILSRELNIARSQSKALLRSGSVALDGKVITSGDFKCPDGCMISVNGELISNNKYVYIMMNKPKGVISAAKSADDVTVVDILPQEMKRKNLFPAGRLDKDTTGFMLITDDGAFAHDILSPKKHIDKTYIATLDKPFDSSVTADFENGMTLNGEKLLKAHIEPVNGDYHIARVVLKQGLYHQVKRMFKKHSITVVELHRVAMGNLPLDENLAPGECRYLTNDEINAVKCRNGVTI